MPAQGPRTKAPPSADLLRTYREKRSAGKTPEPFGNEPAADARTGGGARLFVVQKHDATHLHYDLRLEIDGVLKSWAVPKGPSNDTSEKRFAMQTEDHPIEYAEFEGVIPKGQYGAGPMILWDRGLFLPDGDPREGVEAGKLDFTLRGHKLRGKWHLFRTSGKPREWLLLKRPDGFSGKDRPYTEESVLSGLSLEELHAGGAEGRAAEVRATLERLGAPRRNVDAGSVGLMLAEPRSAPFDSAEHLFELKYDGYRLLAEKHAGGGARLLLRRGSETPAFPEVLRTVAALPFGHLVLDGEVVVPDASGKPSFNALQKRALLSRPADLARAAAVAPATYYAFDLLGFEDFDVRPLPLRARKELLEKLLPKAGSVRYLDHIDTQGVAFFDGVARLRLEGIMAKRKDAPYRAGRSPSWLKIRLEHTDDFAVVGYTEPEGSRTGFGALVLGLRKGNVWVFVGKAGSGFTEKALGPLRAKLEADLEPAPTVVNPPAEKGYHWITPRYVAEVRFKDWTVDGLLREPTFLRLRDDKLPTECLLTDPMADLATETAPAAPAEAGAPAKKAKLSNLTKVFWPEDGYTKGDLVDYYRAVAPHLLPYLADRPLVLTRFPDGIHGKNFFQKDAPDHVPGWLRTVRLFSEHGGREIDYFICESEEALVFLANLATIPLHIWASRVTNLARPDWCLLDLDPKGAPFEDVVSVALAARELTESLELPSYVKTSGSSGLHVLIPLGGAFTHDESKVFGELLARVIVSRRKDIATVNRVVEKREGKVYVDFLQNGHGKLMASFYCVRPLPGAPVSTPLSWSEVVPRLDPKVFTIKSAPLRFSRRPDPMLPVLTDKPDLGAALARLAGLV